MAILDNSNNSVVVKIAYAGPAMSGKTESVRSLASILVGKDRSDKKVYSPNEAQGRTMYFDWLDYTAGSFQGRRVRCQIISAPGQSSLAERRRMILQSADAIIFVLDSSPDRLDDNIASFRELQAWVNKNDTENSSPVGVLVQVNKRDLDNAVSLDEIKQRLQGGESTGYIETVALSGRGIREAFVIGVGLALDHTLDLVNKDLIEVGSPDVADGEELFQKMLEQEKLVSEQAPSEPQSQFAEEDSEQTTPSELGQVLHHMIHPEEAHADQSAVLEGELGPEAESLSSNELKFPLPSIQAPAGTVWPPVIGRFLLNEINTAERYSFNEDETGATIECVGGYLLRAENTDVFSTMAKGREKLLSLASRYIALKDVVNSRRCLVISEVSANEWRLWQIIDAKPSLYDELTETLSLADPQEVSSKVVLTAKRLLWAIMKFAEAKTAPPIRAGLKSVLNIEGSLTFGGFLVHANGDLPDTSNKPKIWPFPIPPLKMVEEELRIPIALALKQKTIDVPAVTRHLEQYSDAKEQKLADMLSFLLLGH